MKHKYVRSRLGFAVFSPHVSHSSMRNSLEEEITSAGFCEIWVDEKGELRVSCFGESIGLGIKSHPGDGEWIRQQLTALR